MVRTLVSLFNEGESLVSTGLFIRGLVNTYTLYPRVLGLKSSGSYSDHNLTK